MKSGIREQFVLFCVFLAVLFCSMTAMAQPSGGPYGPVRQNYDLPKDAGKIYYVSPDANADESGVSLEKPTALASAIERAITGDAIILRGGVYRTGGLKFNQQITIQPYADEQPVLKGTQVAKKWEHQENGLWKTTWRPLFPAKPADWWRQDRTPLHRFNNDMVFIDGRFLQSAGSEEEVNENSYFIDYNDSAVYIGADPANRLVEITAFSDALTRTIQRCNNKASDRKGPVIRGITFTQYAFRAIEIEGKDPEGLSDEANNGKDVVGTILENCTISYCSRVGAYLRGDKLTMRHCLVSDTSTEGIFILASNDVLLEKNIFRRNNIENINGYFPAGVKIFNQCYRVTCRDNLVTEQPNSNGIWYDVGNVNGRFIDNRVEAVGDIQNRTTSDRFWPSNSGFFFEISKGAVCAGNVFVNCDQGIRVLNSSNVEVYNNTLVNSAVFFGRDSRSAVGDHFGWHPSTGPDVNGRNGHVFVNNLLTTDKNYRGPMLVFWQPASLCSWLHKPQVKQLDYNVFVRRGDKTAGGLIWWSPAPEPDCRAAFDSPEQLHKTNSEFSANSHNLVNYDGPLFKNAEQGNYELLQAFEGSKPAAPLPPVISELLELSQKDARFIGAYPPPQ